MAQNQPNTPKQTTQKNVWDTKQNGQPWKGNLLIETTGDKGKFTSIYNSNPNTEYLELDVSKLAGNSEAPAGTIMMVQDTNKIPKGWQICDGSNGTPNLTDFFIMGTTTKSELKTTIGSHDVGVIEHDHTITFNITGNHSHTWSPGTIKTTAAGSHAHNMEVDLHVKVNNSVCWAGPRSEMNTPYPHAHPPFSKYKATSTNAQIWNENSTASGAHKHSLNVGGYSSEGAGKHSHKVTIEKTGSISGNTGKGGNMPPYYTLVYIQKV